MTTVTTKAIAKVAAVATGLAMATSMLSLAPVAHAASLTDSQIQSILSLLTSFGADSSTIANVQASLTGGTPVATTGSAASSCAFTTSLTTGSKGAQVTCLQQALIAAGYSLPAGATGFFGSQTKAAVIAWQKAAGVSPASGYFGAISRAHWNLGGTTTGTTGGTTTGTTGSTGSGSTTGTPTPQTGVVTFSAGQQITGSVISGAAQIPVMNFVVANGTNSDVTVNSLNVLKTGVISDSNIANAYISVGSNIIAQYTGLSNGIVQFQNPNLVIPAGKSITYTLRVDISSGTANGNTLAFSIASPSDAQLSSGTASGSFPVTGGNFTTTSVTNPSIASISNLAYVGVAGTVDAGTTGFRASSLSFTVENSPVKVTGIKFTINGSLNWQQDLANPTIRVDGQQVGTGAVTPDGKVYFDTTANTPILTTGSHQLEVYVDVLGTANRQMQWQLLRPFEWTLVDTQYNTNISGGTPSGTATNTTVRPGNSTIALSSQTPTGNIPLGSSSFVIAKFTYHAAGEPVKIKWLPFKLTKAGGADWSTVSNVDHDIRNIAIYAQDGTQLGTTINVPSACTYGTPSVTSATYICSFGSPNSNINYIVPANTTVTFNMRVDVQAAATTTTLKGSLVAPSASGSFTGNNTEGQISFATSQAPGGTIDGSILTVVTNPFTASQNTSLSNQSVVGGVLNEKVASFSLGASSAEGVKLTSVQLQTSTSSDSSNGPLRLQNLRAQIGSAVLNYNIPSVTASTNYSFSIPSGQTLIPAGGNVVVDVYADVLQSSTANSYTSPISLTGAVGTGALTNTNQVLKTLGGSVVTSLAGQNLTVGTSGAMLLNGVSNDPVISTVVKSTTGVILGKFQMRETTNNESIRIIDITVTASSTNSLTTSSPFQNLTLVDSSGNPIVGAGPLTFNSSSAGITTVKFSPSNMLIPPNGTVVLGLKGDVSPDENFFRVNNGTAWVFSINANSDVNAVGEGSAIAVVPTGAGAGTRTQAITAVAAKLALSSFTKQPGVVINNSTDLKLGQVTFTSTGSAGSYAVLKTLKVTVSGPAVTTNATINPIVYLRNPGDVVIATTTVALSSTTPSAVATFTIATSTTDGRVFVGNDKTYTVSMDTNQFVTPNTGNTNPNVSLQIGAASVLTDVGYATYLGDPNFAETFNLDRLAPSTPLPKTVTIGYQ